MKDLVAWLEQLCGGYFGVVFCLVLVLFFLFVWGFFSFSLTRSALSIKKFMNL